MAMSRKLKKKLELTEIHARLLNWGKWLRWDNTVARLGYPTQCPFVFSPRRGSMIADLDAEHIEWVVSSFRVGGKNPAIAIDVSVLTLYAFILRVEYAERPESSIPHVSQRAEDVRRRFKRPCAEKTYYQHLARAKKAVQLFVDPIK